MEGTVYMNWMKWLGPTYYEGVRENELNETKPCPVWVENVKAKEVSSYKANSLCYCREARLFTDWEYHQVGSRKRLSDYTYSRPSLAEASLLRAILAYARRLVSFLSSTTQSAAW